MGVTQNLESWNHHHRGENRRTDDPAFGPDDINPEQDDDIEPHAAELKNQNRAAMSDLQIATNLAEATRAARRHQPTVRSRGPIGTDTPVPAWLMC